MSILKLANAGDEATLEITGCTVVAGQYGEQVQFDAGEDRLYLPITSADRQLERLGLIEATADGDYSYGAVLGERLTFSRVPSTKPGAKPFWNIAKAGNGKPPVAKANPAKTPIPSHANVPNKDLPDYLRDAEAEDNASLAAKVGVDLSAIEKKLAVYQGITEWYLKNIPPLYDAAKIGCSPESAAAGIHTLFITANK